MSDRARNAALREVLHRGWSDAVFAHYTQADVSRILDALVETGHLMYTEDAQQATRFIVNWERSNHGGGKHERAIVQLIGDNERYRRALEDVKALTISLDEQDEQGLCDDDTGYLRADVDAVQGYPGNGNPDHMNRLDKCHKIAVQNLEVR